MEKAELKMKLLKIGFIVFTISSFVIFISGREYSDSLSCSNVSRWFIWDTIISSSITSILFVFLYKILEKIKNKYINLSIKLIFLNSNWFFWNYILFIDYHACWSTYTFEEALFYVIFNSTVPLILFSILMILGMKKLNQK